MLQKVTLERWRLWALLILFSVGGDAFREALDGTHTTAERFLAAALTGAYWVVFLWLAPKGLL